jgi:GT2 family glycosyltransferase
MSAQSKIVSVVVGSYNRLRFLDLMLDSVRREVRSMAHEIIVVDGGSSDGSLAWLAEQRDVIAIIQHNRGTWRGRPVERRSWGYFMNLGFKAAQGKYICMLSDDCLVVPGAIRHGVEQAERLHAEGGKIGAIAFYWRNWPEQTRYWVGRTFGGTLFVNHGLYLNEALRSIGYADEENYAFYHADGDICLRLAEGGFDCVAAEHSFVEHYSHANESVRKSNLAAQKRDWEHYSARWSQLEAHRRPDDKEPWIYRDFDDPHQTARGFGKLPEVKAVSARMTLMHALVSAKRALWRALRRG